MFVNRLADAEATEAQVWIDFARDCGYLSGQRRDQLIAACEEVSRMLGSMIAAPGKFSVATGGKMK